MRRKNMIKEIFKWREIFAGKLTNRKEEEEKMRLNCCLMKRLERKRI